MSRDGQKGRGGSYPNHPAQKYELPIPFTIGPQSQRYRDAYEHSFGKCDPAVCLICAEQAAK